MNSQSLESNDLDTSLEEGTLAIDLGNSTTVVVFQGEKNSSPQLLNLSPISRIPGEIPSLVWYNPQKSPSLLVGAEVNNSSLIQINDVNLCSDFKRWIGAPEEANHYSSSISPDKAGELLIQKIWEKIPSHLKIKRLVLTAPVETYRAYRHWLLQVCSSLFVKEIALVDEPTAAAMGAGLPPGSKLFVVDVGGSTIDMSVVAIEGGEGKAAPIAQLVRFNGEDIETKSKQVLRCAKVLGKAGQRLGGRDIDRWIGNYLLPNEQQTEELLNTAEKLKCRLSAPDLKETKVLTEISPDSSITMKMSKLSLENLLSERGLLASIRNLFNQTMASAKLNNCDISNLQNVVLVGGGAQIPLIKSWIQKLINPVPLLTPPPVETIAVGALTLTPGVKVRDVLHKGVSLRCWNPKSKSHAWHPLFIAGQPWPTSKPLEIVLSASKLDQEEIEIKVGEHDLAEANEIIYIDGIPTIKIGPTTPKINLLENTECLIELNPPGQPGEDCLKLKFSINNECELKMESMDIRTGLSLPSKVIGSIR